MPEFSGACPNPQGVRAFSLIEVILSLTVLGLALTALVGLVPAGMLNLRAAEQRTTAGQLAQSLLEEASLMDPPAIPAGARDEVELEGITYRPRVDVGAVDAHLPKARRVRVTVQWKHGEISREVFRERVLTRVPR